MIKFRGESHSISDAINVFREREQYLKEIVGKLKPGMKDYPEGNLVISKARNYYRYYQKNNKSKKSEYIPAAKRILAQQLAQKDYDQKVLKIAEREAKYIEKFLAGYPKEQIEDVYEGIHHERQKMVMPVRETDEQYVERWNNVEYQGKPFFEGEPELYTARGERVRSKSEIIIADLLNREGVPYRYEFPVNLRVPWVVSGTRTLTRLYPDFMVMNVRTKEEFYWEHFGRMDDPDYMKKCLKKIQVYGQNGIVIGKKLIVTFESIKSPLNTQDVLMYIDEYLK